MRWVFYEDNFCRRRILFAAIRSTDPGDVAAFYHCPISGG